MKTKTRKRADDSPAGLSAEARRFWRDLLAEHQIDDTAGRKLLERACEALDRMRDAQVHIKKHGAVVPDKKGSIKANPAITIEKEGHRQLMESLRMLNLDLEPLKDRVGRPGGR